MSYRVRCPHCGDPQGVRIVTSMERQGVGPYWSGDVEFLVGVESNCGCALSDEELDECTGSTEQIEEESEG